MEGITKTGFAFKVDADIVNDWEILEELSEMSDGNMLYAPKFMKRVLGNEQAKALKEHCREDGKVPTDKIIAEIFDIFGQFKEGKN